LPRKGDLASRLSMTPEHFSRVLHRLAALGLVQVKGRRVRVPDPVRLRSI
jgi:CRP/FNR family transcriptional regulator, dissimilatory nitrate respiration regulator